MESSISYQNGCLYNEMEWCNGKLEWNTGMTQMAQMFEITIPL